LTVKPSETSLPFDPLDVIAECLGEPADTMRNPANADYLCPYINGTCTKQSHSNALPFPVCSIYRRSGNRSDARLPICVCPVRFYGADIAGDVVRECWTGQKPTAPRIAHEIQMEKFGKVDLVIAELDDAGTAVTKFLPVELQAVDITGTYMGAYEALTQSTQMANRPQYGFNWANVRKRFISQLVAKGFYCHHWQTRIVAVIQEDLFTQFNAHARLPEVSIADSNIVFMLYQYQRADNVSPWTFALRRVVPTTHLSVMQSVLYEQPPLKATFERKILERLQG
jgi:hypothetical protein